jgi:hypothetical protein
MACNLVVPEIIALRAEDFKRRFPDFSLACFVWQDGTALSE